MDYTPYWEAARQVNSVDSAHDFLHVQRVFQNARDILEVETEANQDVVLVAVLLHELFNYPKGHAKSRESGDKAAEHAAIVLEQHNFPRDKREIVLDAIRNHSFSKGKIPEYLEGKILQDADRLDAIGAIGIARCFATCSSMKRPFYDASDPFASQRDLDDKAYGVDHFFTKLLRLPDTMHTVAARELAIPRLRTMERYLDAFAAELGIVRISATSSDSGVR